MHLPFHPQTPADPPTRVLLTAPNWADDTLALPPARFGRYRLLEPLGRGGTAIVWSARDELLGRDVAVKFPANTDSDLLTRFHRESAVIARLSHPHVVSLFDVGESAGRPYMVMELQQGGTLSERAATLAGRWESIARLLANIADGVAAAHAVGLVHRDLKPSNVLFDAAGSPAVADFGLARDAAAGSELTLTGRPIGTPAYMSPEQADGLPADARSDVWSLGVILYELLAGQRPFGGVGPAGTLAAVRLANPPPLPRRVPAGLIAVTRKCLSRDPAGRYAHAGELAADLRRWLTGTAVRAPAHRRVHPALIAVTLGCLLAVAVPWPASVPAPEPLTTRRVEQELAAGRVVPLVSTASLDARSERRLTPISPHLTCDAYEVVGLVRLTDGAPLARAGLTVVTTERADRAGLSRTSLLVALRETADGLELSVGPQLADEATARRRLTRSKSVEYRDIVGPCRPGDWHELRVRIQPGEFAICANGIWCWRGTAEEVEDAALLSVALRDARPKFVPEFASGTVGIYGSSGVAEFRDVRLGPIAEPTP